MGGLGGRITLFLQTIFDYFTLLHNIKQALCLDHSSRSPCVMPVMPLYKHTELLPICLASMMVRVTQVL